MTAATAVKPKTKPAKNPWGTPGTASFQKAYVRGINFEGATAEVHREILDIAVEVLHMAQEQGVLPEGHIASYDKGATEGPAAFGACLNLRGVEGADAWGFAEHPELGLVFGGDLEAAQRLTAMAQELLAARGNHENIIPEEEEAWAHTQPGRRPLAIGNRGDDVQFIQTLLAASDGGGVYDLATERAVAWLQGQNGIEQNGTVDDRTWKLMFPRESRYGIGRDDAGFTVRVAQALIVAYGWDLDLPITGFYGVETDRAIRKVQQQRGLRINGYMRSAEWVALLGPRDEWPGSDLES